MDRHGGRAHLKGMLIHIQTESYTCKIILSMRLNIPVCTTASISYPHAHIYVLIGSHFTVIRCPSCLAAFTQSAVSLFSLRIPFFKNRHDLFAAYYLSTPFFRLSQLTLTDLSPHSLYVVGDKSLNKVVYTCSYALRGAVYRQIRLYEGAEGRAEENE